VGEEPRRDSGHVSLGGVRWHIVQTTQVHLVRLDGTNEVIEDRRAETGGIIEASTNGLEETRGFLSG